MARIGYSRNKLIAKAGKNTDENLKRDSGQFRQLAQLKLPAPTYGQFHVIYCQPEQGQIPLIQALTLVAPSTALVLVAPQAVPTRNVYDTLLRELGVSGAVIKGNFLVNLRPVKILFDIGVSHSFIVHDFMTTFRLT